MVYFHGITNKILGGKRTMKVQKKLVNTGMALALGLGVLGTSSVALASNDKVPYSFTLKANYGNNYSGERYRQTENKDNKWKVNMTYTSEGAGKVATYWLDKSGTQVSDTVDVHQGAGEYKRSAYQTASQSYVRLAAENNNYTSTTYTVSGYWDEEIN